MSAIVDCMTAWRYREFYRLIAPCCTLSRPPRRPPEMAWNGVVPGWPFAERMPKPARSKP